MSSTYDRKLSTEELKALNAKDLSAANEGERHITLENMLIELRQRTHHGKPVREATVQKYLTAVSAVLSDAMEGGFIYDHRALTDENFVFRERTALT